MKRETLIWIVVFVVAAAWLAYRASTAGMGSSYVERMNGAVTGATPADYVAGAAEFSWSRTLGTWTAAIFTLCIFSFLYRDNPMYKLAESIVVGVSAAYWMVVGFWTVVIPNLLGKLDPAWIETWAMPGLSPVREDYWYMYFVPLTLSVMLLWRLAPAGAWISRWPLAWIIGVTAGLRLIGFIGADFLNQIGNSIVPLVVVEVENGRRRIDVWDSLRSIVLILSILACLVYFFFSIEHKGVVAGVSRVGIWVLMITFGAAFGYTVMGRIALLAIRLEFLFDDWLWLIDPLKRRVGL